MKYNEVRMAICEQCDSYYKSVKVCKECGCFMPAKTLLKIAHCPLRKWKAIHNETKDDSSTHEGS